MSWYLPSVQPAERARKPAYPARLDIYGSLYSSPGKKRTLDLQQPSLHTPKLDDKPTVSAASRTLKQLCVQLPTGVLGSGQLATASSLQQQRVSPLSAEHRHVLGVWSAIRFYYFLLMN